MCDISFYGLSFYGLYITRLFLHNIRNSKIICGDISRKLQIVGLFVIGPFFLAHLFIKT